MGIQLDNNERLFKKIIEHKDWGYQDLSEQIGQLQTDEAMLNLIERANSPYIGIVTIPLLTTEEARTNGLLYIINFIGKIGELDIEGFIGCIKLLQTNESRKKILEVLLKKYHDNELLNEQYIEQYISKTKDLSDSEWKINAGSLGILETSEWKINAGSLGLLSVLIYKLKMHMKSVEISSDIQGTEEEIVNHIKELLNFNNDDEYVCSYSIDDVSYNDRDINPLIIMQLAKRLSTDQAKKTVIKWLYEKVNSPFYIAEIAKTIDSDEIKIEIILEYFVDAWEWEGFCIGRTLKTEEAKKRLIEEFKWTYDTALTVALEKDEDKLAILKDYEGDDLFDFITIARTLKDDASKIEAMRIAIKIMGNSIEYDDLEEIASTFTSRESLLIASRLIDDEQYTNRILAITLLGDQPENNCCTEDQLGKNYELCSSEERKDMEGTLNAFLEKKEPRR